MGDSDYFQLASPATILGYPTVTVGTNQKYDPANYPNASGQASFGLALQAAINAVNVNGATNPVSARIEIVGSYTLNLADCVGGHVIIQNATTVVWGQGRNITKISITGNANGADAITGGLSSATPFDWLGGSWEHMNIDCSNVVGITVAVGASPFTYTHGTTGTTPAVTDGTVIVQGGTVSVASWKGGGGAGAARTIDYPANGIIIYMEIGDTLTLTYSVAPTTFTYSSLHSALNVTSKHALAMGETSAPYFVRDVYYTGFQNACFTYILNGCERGAAEDVEAQEFGLGQFICSGGQVKIQGGSQVGVLAAGFPCSFVQAGIGNAGILYGSSSVKTDQILSLMSVFFNGVGSSSTNPSWVLPDLYFLYDNTFPVRVVDNGTIWQGAHAGMNVTFVNLKSWISGDTTSGHGAAKVQIYSAQEPDFIQTSLPAAPSLIDVAFPNCNFYGTIGLHGGGPTVAQFVTNMGLGSWIVDTGGAASLYYNGIVLQGTGQPQIVAQTLAKAETQAADAALLTFTPPAAVGHYRVHVSVDVSSGTAGVVGVTVGNYKDSNSNTVADTDISLAQLGTAAPSLTFTTSAVSHYWGDFELTTDASGTAINIKWVGGGTALAAKVTVQIEKLA